MSPYQETCEDCEQTFTDDENVLSIGFEHRCVACRLSFEKAMLKGLWNEEESIEFPIIN